MHKNIFKFLIYILPILFYACNDAPSSIGVDFLSEDYVNIKQINSFDDSLTQSSNFYKEPVPLGGGSMLFLGKAGNLESSILMKFLIGFADSIKTDLNNNNISVTYAQIEFVKKYELGTPSANFGFTAHKVTSSWSTGSFTGDSLASLQYETDDQIVSGSIDVNDSTTTFKLNNDLVLDWLKDKADDGELQNDGIMLKATDATSKILGYRALLSNDPDIPLLKVIIQKSGVYQDTLTFFPFADLAAVTGNLPDVGSENVAIQGGLVANAKFNFDVSILPNTSVINKAELVLNVDEAESLTGNNFTGNLNVYFIEDSTTMEIDSSRVLVLHKEESIFKGDITAYVQDWVINQQSNEGIIIKYADRRTRLELFAVVGSDAADLESRPRLNIVYTYRE